MPNKGTAWTGRFLLRSSSSSSSLVHLFPFLVFRFFCSMHTNGHREKITPGGRLPFDRLASSPLLLPWTAVTHGHTGRAQCTSPCWRATAGCKNAHIETTSDLGTTRFRTAIEPSRSSAGGKERRRPAAGEKPRRTPKGALGMPISEQFTHGS